MSDPRYYLRGLGAEAEPAASLFPSYSGALLLGGIVAAVLLSYGMRREHRKLRRKRRPGQFFRVPND